mmetsp:Transcript_67100/g.176984  ORF Transcript_67100/g.176984 Transcript_67100/m.176984 type:complete len:202 (+) Transcript_67100:25-630(+)
MLRSALPLGTAFRRLPPLRSRLLRLATRPATSGLIPMVLESTPRGERAFDIFSRLLQERSADSAPTRPRTLSAPSQCVRRTNTPRECRHARSAARSHLPEWADPRRSDISGGRAIALPRGAERREANLHVHQLARRRGDVGPRNLRYDAVREATRRHALCRAGVLHGLAAARSRRARHAARVAQLADHDTPAIGRVSRPGD